VFRSLVTFLLFLLCGLATVVSPAAGQDFYRLGPGDQLRVTVFGHEDLSGTFDIDGNGFISLPLVGTVDVRDKSLSEAKDLIVDKLKPDYLKNPRISVQVTNYRPFYILGEINAPGSYPYVNGMTVLEAVAIAGGFTYRAREREMTIIRGNDKKRKPVPVTPESIVLPGDVIEVPERFF